MWEHLEMTMWCDGTEHCSAYASFELDSRGICITKSYALVNNHVKNNWVIEKWDNSYMGNNYRGIVAKGTRGTLCLKEFKAWLEKNKVPDAYMEWLRSNPDYVKAYPRSAGVEFL